MRTVIILISGLLIWAGVFFYSRLFVSHFPSAVTLGSYLFVVFWFVATAFNMWVGVRYAGYSWREELPVMVMLFVVPVAVALLIRWKVA